MHIKEVISRRDLKRFVVFPDILYRDCPQYVPALHSDQIHSLTGSASLKYCRHKLWLALADDTDVAKGSARRTGDVIGRICAIINPRYNELYGKKCCRFGWFDTVNDIEVAKALMDTASEWAREQGMTQIHGPLYYNTLGKQGMLVEGFQNIPQFNTLYNYPYYVDFMERLGFVKECDWVQYIMTGWDMPERLKKIADWLQEKYKFDNTPVSEVKKNPKQVHDFLKLYSDVFSTSVYNFIPFTEEEIAEEAKTSIPMLEDDYCTLLKDTDGDVAGFAINFPSISKALQKARGHLFPFGWIYLLKALHSYNDTVDLMINGTSEKWHGKGLSAIYHCSASLKLKKHGAKYFITNPQIETNNAVNVWNDYDNQLFMRRRCFIKDI